MSIESEVMIFLLIWSIIVVFFWQFVSLRFEVKAIHDKLKEKPKEEKKTCVWYDPFYSTLPPLNYLYKSMETYMASQMKEESTGSVKDDLDKMHGDVNNLIKSFETKHSVRVTDIIAARMELSDLSPSIPSVMIKISSNEG